MSKPMLRLNANSLSANLFSLSCILGFIVLVWALGSLNGRQTERRLNLPHRHVLGQKDAAIRFCSQNEPKRLTECLYESIKDSEASALTEQDLTAQQAAAWAASASAVLTAFSLVISIGGLYALWRSLKQTERSLNQTSEANDIASKGIVIGKSAQRAYLFVEAFPVNADEWLESEDTDLTWSVKIINAGSTPAVLIHVELGTWVRIVESHEQMFRILPNPGMCDLFGGGVPRRQDIKDRVLAGGGECSEYEVKDTTQLHRQGAMGTVNDFTRTRADINDWIWLHGRVDYLDVWRERQSTTFMFVGKVSGQERIRGARTWYGKEYGGICIIRPHKYNY